jgi:hypothetical protein
LGERRSIQAPALKQQTCRQVGNTRSLLARAELRELLLRVVEARFVQTDFYGTKSRVIERPAGHAQTSENTTASGAAAALPADIQTGYGHF